MIPKSGHRFSEKIMLLRKIQTVALRGSRHHSRGAPRRPSVAKPCHVKREARGGHGKRGVAPRFPYSLRPSRQSQEIKQEIKKEIKEAERRQTQINIRRILRCGARLARRARLSAFHHGSRLREYLIPKAQLQARLPGTRSERALPAFPCPSPRI